MSKWYFRLSPIVVALFLVTIVASGFMVSRMKVEGKGLVAISLNARVAMAAELGGTNGVGEPIPKQDIVPPTFGRGGLPIVSVKYAETGDFLAVVMSGMPTLIVRQTDVASWSSISVVESTINSLIQRQLEVWTPLSSFPKEDPVRQTPPILLDCERIETSGRDYLVMTLGYGAIHIFSLSPFKFTTRFNGLDAGPITGTWW